MKTAATMEKERQIVDLLKDVQAVADKAVSENRDLDDTDRATITEKMGKASALKDEVKKAAGLTDLKAQIAELGNGIGLVDEGDREPIAGNGGPAGKGQTIGDQFAKSEGFTSFLKKFPKSGIPDSAKNIQSPPVEFDSYAVTGYGWKGRRGQKLVTGVSDTSAGALVFPQDLGVRDMGTFQRPLTIVDMITVGQTETDLVQFVKVTGFTNAAAPVAEATAASGTSGTKPMSDLTLVRAEAGVKTIAHWIPATKRALSDAGQVRTLIDNFLDYGLREELEDQIINGDGTGENFDGIANADDVQAQVWDTDLLTTLRKAKTKVRVVGRATPTAYLLHPNDSERLDLLKDLEGRFYFLGPIDGGVQRVWRLPVIESEAVTEGTGYCADFRQAVLWNREQASIQASDSHADFFVRNLVAILAELRAAFGIFRPKAFVEIDLTA